MTAETYLKFCQGNKEKAIEQLLFGINLYTGSKTPKTPKVLKRIADYEKLLTQLNT